MVLQRNAGVACGVAVTKGIQSGFPSSETKTFFQKTYCFKFYITRFGQNVFGELKKSDRSVKIYKSNNLYNEEYK